ncbi:hypothetical protein SERLA73DRAFT_103134 [Serpula lacrymans var. lacrymans S7.3]|uniref:ER membrane protein complex subunit 1 n=1 Tax=Serpula lacrymans var. lacrymans (strain S7.3) TaxID=936435 RepID=F8PN73_SERL3|nr:hypothetical protein SERLA73DRAFT_103134 [Serpula lacrymans var. lacrymans S7.3]
MRLLRQFLVTSLCATLSWALHESDVGVVDWHKKLIGVPLYHSLQTAPVFYQDIVYTATGNNVLAALNATDGSIVWRSIFEPEDPISAFGVHSNTIVSLSGPGGATLREFDLFKGHLLLEKRLHDPLLGHLWEPSNLGTSIISTGASSSSDSSSSTILALTNGDTLTSINSSTGETHWEWTSPDKGTLIIYSKAITTPTTAYVIGFAKSASSFTLHVTSLSMLDGEVIASVNIPANFKNGLTDYIAITSGSDTISSIAWLDQGSIKAASLKPNLKGQVFAIKGMQYKRIMDVGLSHDGQFIAIKEDGAAQVLLLDPQTSSLKVIWEFTDSAPSKLYSDSHYVGGLNKDGEPRIARVYWSNVHNRVVHQVFSAQLAEGKGSVSGFTFPFETSVHGIVAHVAFDVAGSDESTGTRFLLTSSTGSVQLWQQDLLSWAREESLATIKVAEIVEMPQEKMTEEHVRLEEEGFFERVTRQFSDAKNLPQYAVNFARRFATGSHAPISISQDEESVSRDAFGFRQVIVAATSHGKIFGIDSSNGEILWSRVLGLGWAAEVGGTVIPVKLYVTRTVSDGDAPQVTLVTQRRADNTLVDTVIFHLDVLTGDDVRAESKSPSGAILEGFDIISGPLIEAFMLPTQNKTIMLLDEFLQVRIYPDTPEAEAEFQALAPSLHFSLRTGGPGQRKIMGHQTIYSPDLSMYYMAYPTWTIPFPPEEDVKAIIPSSPGLLASFGHVLGNRTTLYKYLNPHLTAVLTSSLSNSPPTCSIYLLDGVSGSIVYHSSIPAASGVCDVKATLAENWLVYHYFDDELAGSGQSKGHRIVSVELYEGNDIDEKIKSSDITSYSNKSAEVTAYERSFVLPYGLAALTTTTTKFGITTKDLIVASRKNNIQSIPRRLLNSRRPRNKPTNEEMEEMLVQYDPLLPDDARLIVSHNYEVANVNRIVTAPSLLESTSLVFVHGLDLFFTRTAPSNTFDVLSENFNKVQLVLTIVGLATAIIVTRPMMRRKRLRERWYR